MPVSIKVEQQEIQVGLSELRVAATDVTPLLKIAGELMRGSIARTFRDEGSPAGSWPRLALSTLKRKGYTAGHKLLVMTGRLFGSFTYAVTGSVLTIGTNVPYAAVHQYGSADRLGGSIGAQAKLADRASKIAAHYRVITKKFAVKDAKGKTRFNKFEAKVRVRPHSRHQNIPARPYLVFRPEDPSRIARGMEAYLRGRAVRIGKLTFQQVSTGGAA